jgi:hypothetical protein
MPAASQQGPGWSFAYFFECHNLTCLIQEQETPGIVPVFWKDEGRDEGPAVLPMVRPG